MILLIALLANLLFSPQRIPGPGGKAPSGGGGAITQVQKIHNYPSGSGSFTLTFGSSVVAGHLIVVGVGASNTGGISISASGGGTYVCTAGPTGAGLAGGQPSSICYTLSATGGATTVTVTCAACSDMGGTAVEYAGCSCAVDNIGTAGNIGSGLTPTATPTSNSFTPASSGEVLFWNFADEFTSFSSITAGAGYTLINADTSHNDAQEHILSSTGIAQTASFTLNTTSLTWALQGLAFK